MTEPAERRRAYAAVDLDGVVADVRHRLHHVEGRRKDWAAFFAAARDDAVLPEGRAVAERLAAECDLIWLTGRPEGLRAETEAWLAANGLPAGRLVMRREGDRRPARGVKVALLRSLARRQPVAVLVDDDAAVCAAARAAGFAVLQADWMPTERPAQQALFEAQEDSGRT